jgi:hypothetical protein
MIAGELCNHVIASRSIVYKPTGRYSTLQHIGRNRQVEKGEAKGRLTRCKAIIFPHDMARMNWHTDQYLYE